MASHILTRRTDWAGRSALIVGASALPAAAFFNALWAARGVLSTQLSTGSLRAGLMYRLSGKR